MSEKRSPARGDGPHVLVVVEDAETTELLATTMELAGYRVSTVSTGAEAMVRLVEDRFDLVVLDADPARSAGPLPREPLHALLIAPRCSS